MTSKQAVDHPRQHPWHVAVAPLRRGHRPRPPEARAWARRRGRTKRYPPGFGAISRGWSPNPDSLPCAPLCHHCRSTLPRRLARRPTSRSRTRRWPATSPSSTSRESPVRVAAARFRGPPRRRAEPGRRTHRPGAGWLPAEPWPRSSPSATGRGVPISPTGAKMRQPYLSTHYAYVPCSSAHS